MRFSTSSSLYRLGFFVAGLAVAATPAVPRALLTVAEPGVAFSAEADVSMSGVAVRLGDVVRENDDVASESVDSPESEDAVCEDVT